MQEILHDALLGFIATPSCRGFVTHHTIDLQRQQGQQVSVFGLWLFDYTTRIGQHIAGNDVRKIAINHQRTCIAVQHGRFIDVVLFRAVLLQDVFRLAQECFVSLSAFTALLDQVIE